LAGVGRRSREDVSRIERSRCVAHQVKLGTESGRQCKAEAALLLGRALARRTVPVRSNTDLLLSNSCRKSSCLAELPAKVCSEMPIRQVCPVLADASPTFLWEPRQRSGAGFATSDEKPTSAAGSPGGHSPLQMRNRHLLRYFTWG